LKEVFRTIHNEFQVEKTRRKLREKYPDEISYRRECDELQILYEAEPGDRGKDHRSVVQFVTIMRGVSSHPYMLEPIFENLYSVEEAETLYNKLREDEEASPSPMFKQIGEWNSRAEIIRKQSATRPTTGDARQISFPFSLDGSFGKGRIGHEFHFVRQLQSIITAKKLDMETLECVGVGRKECPSKTGSLWQGQVSISKSLREFMLNSIVNAVRSHHLRWLQVGSFCTSTETTGMFCSTTS